MISVIIVDDHPLVLNGFEFILKNTSTIVLRGSFNNAKDAFDFLATEAVDVILMDINMPDMNGIEATEIIKKQCPDTQIIAISNHNEGSIALRMLKAGAMGYLLKNVSTDELIEGIQAVIRGEQVLSKEMNFILTDKKDPIPSVSQREREVLRLMAQGHTTAKIGEQMFISPLTVESHRRNLLQKFGVVNSASLIHKATEMKFI
ncbi:DNA-binding response regulator [Sphingobacterium faecium NBRC 15299]|uniref:response regulator n=1 Tax=Sphingobacterium faecium TaxID=34087 RepID=UPI000D388269|nr:response regulator transcription factor [Sphingobacterium faecium]PTX12487.1 LuxR family two component transcriptional regulator [Sphingobacterium faecium]GEM62196.1 DNA-binding response regulator [Sphingobacterium faecium NBRC 15299]